MRARSFDRAVVAKLLRSGLSQAEISRRLDVSEVAISRAIAAGQVPGFGPGQAVVEDPAPVVPVLAPDDRRGSLIATGGRYAELVRWGERFGVTAKQALVEWHRVRGSKGVVA